MIYRFLFLWFDRFAHRIFPIAFVSLFILLLYEPARRYSDILVIIPTAFALLWGLYDLYRGVELDHEYKDETLRNELIE
jgi:hypothetical protein